MPTIEALNQLYQDTEHRKLIEAVDEEQLNLATPQEAEKILLKAWSYHQLGEYHNSVPLMETLCKLYQSASKVGESARRGLAHGLLQWKSDIQRADKILQDIPPSLGRDNVRMNLIITAVRQGLEIPAAEVMTMIGTALLSPPYATINGHIINNGTFALHEARDQVGARWYLPALPGLIEIAIGIYAETGTAKKHLAGACYRGSLIFEAAGSSWYEGAEELARDSVNLWRELVSSQDGVRFQKNLDGALAQLKKLEEME